MATEITPREALSRLGASTAEAVARVLEMFAPGSVGRGEVTVSADGQSPLVNLPVGGIAASVSYVDGVTGANVFVMSRAGARALATAMGVGAPEEDATAELTELELSAIGEAANQTLAAAAAAISVVIGQEIEISPPDVRVLTDSSSAVDAYGTAPHACSTSFSINGESCRLIQLVPSAFVVRMARAIDELGFEQPPSEGADRLVGDDGSAESFSLKETLGTIILRVWAELGRAQLALGDALELPVGAVVDLDRGIDAPVDLFVNGLCFGQGQLLVTDAGEWAIQIAALNNPMVRKPALAGSASGQHP
jgi:flagellar motor switch protein FliN/FliY